MSLCHNSEHLYNSEHPSKSKVCKVYICSHLRIQNPRVDLEENVSHFKAICSAGALYQVTCLCRWRSHRKE